MLLSVARHRRFYDDICIKFLFSVQFDPPSPLIFTCSYIFYLFIFYIYKCQPEIHSPVVAKPVLKIAHGIDSGEAWHDKMCGPILRIMVDSLPSSSPSKKPK